MARHTQDSSKTNLHGRRETDLLKLRPRSEAVRFPRSKEVVAQLGQCLERAPADVQEARVTTRKTAEQVGDKVGSNVASSAGECVCTRLSREELRRRQQSGRCTYCSGVGHVRSSCALGRLMRRVSKGELTRRLRDNLCPLCGDPKMDGHRKLDCPRKAEMEEQLNALKGYPIHAGQPSAGQIERSLHRVHDWNQRGGQAGAVPVERPVDVYGDGWEVAEWMRSRSSSSAVAQTPGTDKESGDADGDGKHLPPYPLEDDFLIDLRDY
ncbi:hypothetical protein CMQ_4989 [Grosmannia clavigera kw1407]|uniref:CCHC-type domain-containing protein n=1 Tax=Grosmannia clavigera (strain kw1407 / UAMH 11150) TaxID=655863 RepID=F0XK85_GROCL|nr:uncharacterized protein CMQ_4989 [Grosmannia clavigera kw1407]EFX01918.1 hypothetical protein CMQ_4989 [Grosmannia clavigera kw1407]